MKRREPAVGLGVELGAVLKEATGHSDVAPSTRAVQGRPAVDGTRVHLGAADQQCTDDFHVAAVRRAVQRRVTILITGVHQ